MVRVFTKNVKNGKVVRWAKGTTADYPKFTWDQIAESLGEDLDDFSTPVADAIQKGVKAA